MTLLITITHPGPTASGLRSRKLHRTHSLLATHLIYRAVFESLFSERTSWAKLTKKKQKIYRINYVHSASRPYGVSGLLRGRMVERTRRLVVWSLGHGGVLLLDLSLPLSP